VNLLRSVIAFIFIAGIIIGCIVVGFMFSEREFVKDCLNNGKTQVGKRWFYCAEK